MPGGWRCTLRVSKTESMVRANFESRAGPGILLEQAPRVLETLRPFRANPDDDIEELSIQ